MGSVTTYTAARMQAMSDNSIVSASVDSDGNLDFITRGGKKVSGGNIKGLRGSPGATPNASTTVEGLIRLASEAEVLAGTNSTKVVTPAALNPLLKTPADVGRVLLTSTSNIAVNSTIPFDTVSYDPNSLWDTTHKQFVVKRSGYYLATGKLSLSVSAGFALSLRYGPSASMVVGADGAPDNNNHGTVRSLLKLNTGDAVKIVLIIAGVTPAAGTTGNFFELEYRRPL